MEIKVPSNIGPKEFFEEFLPKEYQRIKETVKLPLNFNAGAEILGKGGGDWSLIYDNGNLKVKRGIPDEPLFTLSIKTEDWKKAIDNDLTSIFISSTDTNNLILKYLTQNKIDRIKNEHGKINVTVDNIAYEGEIFNFKFSIIIGEPLAKDPELSLKITKKEFEEIRKNPQNLYKLISLNQLNIEGDFRYLMKLATMVFF